MNVLELFKAPNVELWSRLAMAHQVWSDEFVENVQLTHVHGFCEPPDKNFGLVAGHMDDPLSISLRSPVGLSRVA